MITTEQRHPDTYDLDRLSTIELVTVINRADQLVASAVAGALEQISNAVDAITGRLATGGRLFYVGSGTSGRLAVLDAVECPPTFGVSPDLVQAVLAGGYQACYSPIEAAEDDAAQGEADLRERGVRAADAVVGIAASGRTPYTLGAVRFARQIGALTVGISCNRNSPLSAEAEIPIEVETGPEVLTGSTRMKAGTAQKLILNMLSTAVMVRLGHVYSNLMVNVHLKNKKLVERGVHIICDITGRTEDEARQALEKTGDAKSAVVLLKLGCGVEEARQKAARVKLRELIG
ncbi:MAG TPA: N-acetylmuramic acid 6-phosphate etherase [Acidobacteriota bacterium]|nr:N-acetylmuramic acid 6-phosphate etherase [Acidobacteriota bacterium]